MGSRMSSFLQDQFQLPTLLPTPTFTCFPSRHRHRLHLPSLKLSKTSKAVALIITNETLEKMCSIGAISLLQFFLMEAFNFTEAEAANTMLFFGGVTNLVPIVGAVLSDTYFGRFRTLCFSTPCSLVGSVLLTVTALPGMHPRQNPTKAPGMRIMHPLDLDLDHQQVVVPMESAKAWQKAVLYGSFFFFTLAAAGIRSCNLPFGIDQYDLTTEAGQRGKESFTGWNYASFTLSITASVIVIPIVQEITKSWVVGFLIPTCFMLLSCLLFFAGTPLYVKAKPEGSPVVAFLRVFVASFMNRNLPLTSDPNQLFSNAAAVTRTNNLRFLEKAAILPAAVSRNAEEEEEGEGEGEITTMKVSAGDYLQQHPWRLCSMEEVEDAKSVVKVMLMWTPAIIYQMVASEIGVHGNFQAKYMDRKIGTKLKLPEASMGIFSAVALTTWVTVYAKLIIPLVRKRRNSSDPAQDADQHNNNKRFILDLSTLQRIGVGMCLSTLAAAVAAIVEGQRRRSAQLVSVFWLAPQLVLVGLAEAFNGVAQIEFYYSELPASMASLTGAFFAAGYSFGSFAAYLLELIIQKTTKSSANPNSWVPKENLNEGKLDYQYFVVAGLAATNLLFFLFLAKNYKYKLTTGN